MLVAVILIKRQRRKRRRGEVKKTKKHGPVRTGKDLIARPSSLMIVSKNGDIIPTDGDPVRAQLSARAKGDKLWMAYRRCAAFDHLYLGNELMCLPDDQIQDVFVVLGLKRPPCALLAPLRTVGARFKATELSIASDDAQLDDVVDFLFAAIPDVLVERSIDCLALHAAKKEAAKQKKREEKEKITQKRRLRAELPLSAPSDGIIADGNESKYEYAEVLGEEEDDDGDNLLYEDNEALYEAFYAMIEDCRPAENDHLVPSPRGVRGLLSDAADRSVDEVDPLYWDVDHLSDDVDHLYDDIQTLQRNHMRRKGNENLRRTRPNREETYGLPDDGSDSEDDYGRGEYLDSSAYGIFPAAIHGDDHGLAETEGDYGLPFSEGDYGLNGTYQLGTDMKFRQMRLGDDVDINVDDEIKPGDGDVYPMAQLGDGQANMTRPMKRIEDLPEAKGTRGLRDYGEHVAANEKSPQGLPDYAEHMLAVDHRDAVDIEPPDTDEYYAKANCAEHFSGDKPELGEIGDITCELHVDDGFFRGTPRDLTGDPRDTCEHGDKHANRGGLMAQIAGDNHGNSVCCNNSILGQDERPSLSIVDMGSRRSSLNALRLLSEDQREGLRDMDAYARMQTLRSESDGCLDGSDCGIRPATIRGGTGEPVDYDLAVEGLRGGLECAHVNEDLEKSASERADGVGDDDQFPIPSQPGGRIMCHDSMDLEDDAGPAYITCLADGENAYAVPRPDEPTYAYATELKDDHDDKAASTEIMVDSGAARKSLASSCVVVSEAEDAASPAWSSVTGAVPVAGEEAIYEYAEGTADLSAVPLRRSVPIDSATATVTDNQRRITLRQVRDEATFETAAIVTDNRRRVTLWEVPDAATNEFATMTMEPPSTATPVPPTFREQGDMHWSKQNKGANEPAPIGKTVSKVSERKWTKDQKRKKSLVPVNHNEMAPQSSRDGDLEDVFIQLSKEPDGEHVNPTFSEPVAVARQLIPEAPALIDKGASKVSGRRWSKDQKRRKGLAPLESGTGSAGEFEAVSIRLNKVAGGQDVDPEVSGSIAVPRQQLNRSYSRKISFTRRSRRKSGINAAAGPAILDLDAPATTNLGELPQIENADADWNAIQTFLSAVAATAAAETTDAADTTA